MFSPKLKIRSALLEKIKLAAETSGSSSVEELVEKILEREVDKILSQSGRKEMTKAETDELAEKLKGLGYID